MGLRNHQRRRDSDGKHQFIASLHLYMLPSKPANQPTNHLVNYIWITDNRFVLQNADALWHLDS